MLNTRELYRIRDKMRVNKQTSEEVEAVFDHVDALESLLDEADMDDIFGDDGWRQYIEED